MKCAEDLLQDYEGTVFLVSHDRSFLDNVVTSTIVFEGEGRWREYEGDVEDWITQARRASALVAPAPTPAPAKAASVRAPTAKRKLSYKDQRELEALPGLIDTLEQEQNAIHAELADGSLYGRDPARAALLTERGARIEEELFEALERWEALGSTSG